MVSECAVVSLAVDSTRAAVSRKAMGERITRLDHDVLRAALESMSMIIQGVPLSFFLSLSSWHFPEEMTSAFIDVS